MSKKPKPRPAGKYRVELLGEPGSGHSGPILSTFGHSVPIRYTQAEWRKYSAMRESYQRERERDFRLFAFDWWYTCPFRIKGWDLR